MKSSNSISRRVIFLAIFIVTVLVYWFSINLLDQVNINRTCESNSCIYWGFSSSIFIVSNIIVLFLFVINIYAYLYPKDFRDFNYLYRATYRKKPNNTFKNWKISNIFLGIFLFTLFLIIYYFQTNTYLVINNNNIVIKKPPVISKKQTVPLNSIKIEYGYQYYKPSLGDFLISPRCDLKIYMQSSEFTIEISQFAINNSTTNGKAKLISDFQKANVPVTRQNIDNRCSSSPNL